MSGKGRLFRQSFVQGVRHQLHVVEYLVAENKIIDPGAEVGRTPRKIERRDDLGGLLRYYYRAA